MYLTVTVKKTKKGILVDRGLIIVKDSWKRNFEDRYLDNHNRIADYEKGREVLTDIHDDFLWRIED